MAADVEYKLIQDLRAMIAWKVKEIGQMRTKMDSLYDIIDTLAKENYQLRNKTQCNLEPRWINKDGEFLN